MGHRCTQGLKQLLGLVMLLVLSMSLVLPVSAQNGSTTLTTTVPSKFQMDLRIEGKGRVKVNRKTYRKSALVPIDRLTQEEIRIRPGFRYKIDTVVFNGEDVTSQVQNGVFRTPLIQSDATLAVRFVRKSGGNDFWGSIQDWLDSIFGPKP